MQEEKEAKVVMVRNGENVSVSCWDVDMPGLAMMLGVFAGTVATEAIKRGMSVDDVKDAMQDIFLASTARLDERTAEEIINGNTVL